ncbi:MAG: TolC family protein [Myxococcota bacterium]
MTSHDPQTRAGLLLALFATALLLGRTENAWALPLHSVSDAIKYAMEHNRELGEYELRHEQAKRDFATKRYHWLPQVSAAGSLTRNGALPVTPVPGELFGQPGEVVNAEFGQTYNYQTGLSVSTSVLDIRAYYAAKAAKIGAERAFASTDAFKQQLVEQVVINYFTALATRDLLRNQQSNEADAQTLCDIVDAKMSQGVVDKTAVNRARISQNASQLDTAQYQDLLEQTLTNLRILLGLSSNTEITLTEPTVPPGSRLLEVPLGPDRTLKVDELQAAQTRDLFLEQRYGRLPELSVEAFLGAQQLRDDFGLSFGDGDWSRIQYVTLNLNFPLFTGFRQTNQVKAAKAARLEAQHALERRREESRALDESLDRRRRISWRQVTHTRENEKLSRTNAHLALKKYEEGLIDLENYLDVLGEQRNAQAAYLNALLTYYQLVSTYLSREYRDETNS